LFLLPLGAGAFFNPNYAAVQVTFHYVLIKVGM